MTQEIANQPLPWATVEHIELDLDLTQPYVPADQLVRDEPVAPPAPVDSRDAGDMPESAMGFVDVDHAIATTPPTSATPATPATPPATAASPEAAALHLDAGLAHGHGGRAATPMSPEIATFVGSDIIGQTHRGVTLDLDLDLTAPFDAPSTALVITNHAKPQAGMSPRKKTVFGRGSEHQRVATHRGSLVRHESGRRHGLDHRGRGEAMDSIGPMGTRFPARDLELVESISPSIGSSVGESGGGSTGSALVAAGWSGGVEVLSARSSVSLSRRRRHAKRIDPAPVHTKPSKRVKTVLSVATATCVMAGSGVMVGAWFGNAMTQRVLLLVASSPLALSTLARAHAPSPEQMTTAQLRAVEVVDRTLKKCILLDTKDRMKSIPAIGASIALDASSDSDVIGDAVRASQVACAEKYNVEEKVAEAVSKPAEEPQAQQQTVVAQKIPSMPKFPRMPPLR